MAKRFLTTQRIVNLASDPVSATAGEVYYNTSVNSLKYYDGTSWLPVGSSGASVTVSETPPENPEEGDLWYESDTAKTFIYYDNFWVEIGGGGGGGASLPDQTGNSGKYLTTDGTEPSWSAVDADLLDGQDGAYYLDWTNTTNKPDPTITLDGDLEGSITLTDLAGGTLSATIKANSVELGTDTTGQYVSAISGTANQITASGSGTESVSISLSLPSSVIFPGTVTLHADPTQALQAATKQYVDTFVEGLHVHASCATATTTNISNLSSPPASINGVTLTNNMRVLVKNQSTTSQNGIYVFNGTSLVRATDFDSSVEIDGGDFVFVTGGNTTAGTGWVQTETVATVGTDPIIFTQFSGAGTYTAGTGLTLNGNQFSNTGVLSVNGLTGVVSGLAPTSSPTFTGTVTVPTPVNATDAATKEYVDNLAVEEVYYQDAAPSSIPVGTVWIESDVDVSETTYHTTYAADAPTSPVLGDLWIESDVDLDVFQQTVVARYTENISSPKTLFDSGFTYQVGYEQVFLNGVLLVRGSDYTATDGTSITLSETARAGDVVEIISTTTINLTDTYTQGQIDASLATKANIASPTFTGVPLAPTASADTNTTQLATTAFVLGQAASVNPSALGSAASGTSARYARADHVHPTTGLGLTSGTLAQFASTTSSQLAGIISDETGTGSLVFGTSPTLSTPIMLSPEERCNIVAAAATGTINFDVLTSTIWFYTNNATADHTLNFRGNSGNTLNSLLAVGDSISLIWLNTNGASAFRPTVFQIDGANVTPRWSGGTAPSAGNANSIDAYSFSIIKTGATPTYTVLAGQVRFA